MAQIIMDHGVSGWWFGTGLAPRLLLTLISIKDILSYIRDRVPDTFSLVIGKILHFQQSLTRLSIISHRLAIVRPLRLGGQQ